MEQIFNKRRQNLLKFFYSWSINYNRQYFSLWKFIVEIDRLTIWWNYYRDETSYFLSFRQSTIYNGKENTLE